MPYSQYLNRCSYNCFRLWDSIPMHASTILLEPHYQGRVLYSSLCFLVRACSLEYRYGYHSIASSDSCNSVPSDGQEPEVCSIWSFQSRFFVSFNCDDKTKITETHPSSVIVASVMRMISLNPASKTVAMDPTCMYHPHIRYTC